ncbi:conserved hypothetical protein [Vibrio crassostreae]|jgi:hypothetical protein|uniref:Uncharacterized protein n=1 Tax=Vibrio crassostreae TaxID=246167 RepID=A0ABM9R102_9VIBR|nr:hypothetical protein EDB52_12510 [Vibrio crassostreae]TCO00632.1 hypothetical protein EDB30_11011 [Vibrio crassostreae]TCT44443.1 hypothetical protein EDB39_12721 [Vibrio crassostreae]TCT48249.1 hypothetical protein EDB40_12921 [Vibrio crassostreae]TCT49282.1 hypothetical protein EDB42_110179 [Vibrio crassostreae]
MSVTQCDKSCPETSGHGLTEEDKRRGLRYIRIIRRELCARQLSSLWVEQARLMTQLRRSNHVFEQVRLRIRLFGLEKRIQRIRQRWL